jgi:hypothetical protein
LMNACDQEHAWSFLKVYFDVLPEFSIRSLITVHNGECEIHSSISSSKEPAIWQISLGSGLENKKIHWNEVAFHGSFKNSFKSSISQNLTKSHQQSIINIALETCSLNLELSSTSESRLSLRNSRHQPSISDSGLNGSQRGNFLTKKRMTRDWVVSLWSETLISCWWVIVGGALIVLIDLQLWLSRLVRYRTRKSSQKTTWVLGTPVWISTVLGYSGLKHKNIEAWKRIIVLDQPRAERIVQQNWTNQKRTRWASMKRQKNLKTKARKGSRANKGKQQIRYYELTEKQTLRKGWMNSRMMDVHNIQNFKTSRIRWIRLIHWTQSNPQDLNE